MDLTEYLARAATTAPEASRPLAQRLLDGLRQGTVPNPRELGRLRAGIAAATRPATCVRIEEGQVCTWLRQHGARLDIKVPPAGAPAKCPFRALATWDNCPGYRRVH